MYKKVAVLFILIACFYKVDAQIQKGSLCIGANGIIYFAGSSSGWNTLAGIIDPEVSYLLTNKLACGFKFSYYTSKNYNQTKLVSGNQNIYVSFLVKKYIPLKNDKLGFFVCHEIGNSQSSTTYNSYVLKSWTYLMSPGFYIFLNDQCALELYFSNAYISHRTNNYAKYDWGINTYSQSFLLGFKWYLSKSRG